MLKYSQYQRALQAVLAEARRATGLSKRELSEKLGRRQNFVSQIELGQRKLGAAELPEYGAAVGLNAIEIVARMEAERALHITAEASAAAQRVHLKARKKVARAVKKKA